MNPAFAAEQRLLAAAQARTVRGNCSAWRQYLQANWSPDCLAALLDSPRPEVRRAVSEGLGLIGDMSQCEGLARLLHCEDSTVVSAAENALWAIWFRAAGDLPRTVLWKIARSSPRQHPRQSALLISGLIDSYPSFAEAHHQRGQFLFLAEDPAAALRDARRAYELNPWHFEAHALAGSACLCLGQPARAEDQFRRALAIHPGLPGPRRVLRELNEAAAGAR